MNDTPSAAPADAIVRGGLPHPASVPATSGDADPVPPRSLALRALGPLMAVVDAPMRVLQRRLGIKGLAWVFLAPNLLLFGLFAFLPVGLNLVYALTGGANVLLPDRPFVGGANFAQLAECGNYFSPNSCGEDKFWRSVHNTFWFMLLQVGAMVGLSLLTAVVLNGRIRARGFFRAVFFFPVLLSPVVVALVWKWILQRNGVLNAALQGIGLEGQVWLLDASWAFFWSVFISVWAHMGFYTLILLAGLQAIPRDVYEAATMDAASPWRTFRRITLPMLMPTMLVVLVLALIKGVQTFDEVYAFTGGGPGSATLLVIQYVYETGFGGAPRLFGLAAAASVMLALVLVVLTTVQLWVTRRNADG